MRGLRSTIVLLVVLIAVGGYAYYISKKPAEDTSSKQEKVFGSVQADKIDEIRIKSAGGDATTVRKENGAWQVVDPIKARADESELSGLTSALAQLSVVRVIDRPACSGSAAQDRGRPAADGGRMGVARRQSWRCADRRPPGAL